MKCLITGATGFIGSAITKKLAEEGHQIKAIIHNKQPKFIHKNVDYIKCDISNYSSLKKLNNDYDFVFHCAALVKDFGSKDNFYKINYEGTKNIAKLCKNPKLFIYISHIRYESNKKYGYYTQTKNLAEQYLLNLYKKNNYPVIVIRPGNVYGPGATTWVLRPLQAIKNKRISLINKGEGIFHHTYIDNLIDAIILAMKSKKIGETFDITDGDHSINWKKYLNDLAKIANEKPIKRNMSKTTALIIAKIMIIYNKITGKPPIITPTAVYIFTNKKEISIKKAEEILKYKPKVNYIEGMKQVKKWLTEENLI